GAELAGEGHDIRTCSACAYRGRNQRKANREHEATDHGDRAGRLVSHPGGHQKQDERAQRKNDLGSYQREGTSEIHQCAPSCASVVVGGGSPIDSLASPSGLARARRASSAWISARIGARTLSG